MRKVKHSRGFASVLWQNAAPVLVFGHNNQTKIFGEIDDMSDPRLGNAGPGPEFIVIVRERGRVRVDMFQVGN